MDDAHEARRPMLEPLEQRFMLSASPAVETLRLPVAEMPAVAAVRRAGVQTPHLVGTYVGKLRIGGRIVTAKLVITKQTVEPVFATQGKFSAGKLARNEPFGGFGSADGTFAARMGLSRLYVKKIVGEGQKLQGTVGLKVGSKMTRGTFSVVRIS